MKNHYRQILSRSTTGGGTQAWWSMGWLIRHPVANSPCNARLGDHNVIRRLKRLVVNTRSVSADLARAVSQMGLP
jgi:hypothetical protein